MKSRAAGIGDVTEIRNRIVVRQARYRDTESVGKFLTDLPLCSRYHRFFSGIRYISPALARNMVTITPNQLVLLALDGETVVGHTIATCIDEHTVDVGIVIAGAYQHCGIGDRLVHELAATLTASGVTEVCCDVLSENHLVLNWLARLLPKIQLERDGETTTVHGRFTAHSS